MHRQDFKLSYAAMDTTNDAVKKKKSIICIVCKEKAKLMK